MCWCIASRRGMDGDLSKKTGTKSSSGTRDSRSIVHTCIVCCEHSSQHLVTVLTRCTHKLDSQTTGTVHSKSNSRNVSRWNGTGAEGLAESDRGLWGVCGQLAYTWMCKAGSISPGLALFTACPGLSPGRSGCDRRRQSRPFCRASSFDGFEILQEEDRESGCAKLGAFLGCLGS